MPKKTEKRQKTEEHMKLAFKQDDINLAIIEDGESFNNMPDLPQEDKDNALLLASYLNKVDNISSNDIDKLTEKFGDVRNLDKYFKILKEDRELVLSQDVDAYLTAVDKLDDTEARIEAETENFEKQNKIIKDTNRKLDEQDFNAEGGWKYRYDSLQVGIGTMISSAPLIKRVSENEVRYSINEQFIKEQYADPQAEIAFVDDWQKKGTTEDKFSQKAQMANRMKLCAKATEPLIGIYKAFADFCNEKTPDSYEKANKSIGKFASSLENYLKTSQAALMPDVGGNINDFVVNRDTVTMVMEMYRDVNKKLSEDLEIELQKEKESGLLGFDTTGKKKEHRTNAEYIRQNQEMIRGVLGILSILPHYQLVRDEKNVVTNTSEKGFYDPLMIRNDLKTDSEKYQQLLDDFHKADEERVRSSEALFDLGKDKPELKKAVAEKKEIMDDSHNQLKNFNAKVTKLKTAIKERKEELEFLKKIAEEQARKKAEEELARKKAEENKKQEEASQHEEEPTLSERLDQMVREEDTMRRAKAMEAERGALQERREKEQEDAQKYIPIEERKINLHVYGEELQRLAKALEKTVHIGQSNTKGFKDLQAALKEYRDHKGPFGDFPATRGDFKATMQNVEAAISRYVDDHADKDGVYKALDSTQLQRLKIMSRIKDTIAMAWDGIDPYSVKGRVRMLTEKYNNAKCIEIQTSSTADKTAKQKAKAEMLSFSTIGSKGVEAAKNDMKPFWDKFEEQNYSSNERKLPPLERFLKKPGAKFLADVKAPEKIKEYQQAKAL